MLVNQKKYRHQMNSNKNTEVVTYFNSTPFVFVQINGGTFKNSVKVFP